MLSHQHYGSILRPEETVMRKVTSGDLMYEACCVIEDAYTGIHRPHPRITTALMRQLYRIHGVMHHFRTLAVILLVGLSFFEVPQWCEGERPWPCGNPASLSTPLMWYWQWQSQDDQSFVLLISRRTSRVIESICSSFLLINVLISWMYLGTRNFLLRKERLATLILCAFSLGNAVQTKPYAIATPYLRIGIFIITTRGARRAFRKIVVIMPEVHNIISLVVVFVGLSAWIGTILFHHTREGDEEMPNVGEAAWNLFILLTTANYPDVMMPAYSTNRLSSIFFVVFLCFGLFFLMNVALAVIYNNFEFSTRMSKQSAIITRRHQLQKAFQLLRQLQVDNKDRVPSSGLSKSVVMDLFHQLNHYKGIQYIPTQDMPTIFQTLNTSATGEVSESEFIQLFHVLDTYSSIYVDDDDPGRRYPRLRAIIQHRYLESIVDGLLLVNASCVVAESWAPLNNYSDSSMMRSRNVQGLELLFSLVFFAEMSAKLIVYGRKRYWDSWKNRGDCIITIVCFLYDIYLLTGGSGSDITREFLLMRFLRVFRFVLQIKRYRAICATSIQLLPAAMDLINIMFCVMYLFAAVGIQLFGGKIHRLNPLLSHTTFAQNNYFANNFNDMFSSFITLFELLVVNNWYVIADGHVLVTSKNARMFFLAFYFVGVVLMLNLVVAHILNAFVNEWEKKTRQRER